MSQEKLLTEKELATLAKKFREAAGKSRAEAGRELDVSHVSIHRAEENPEAGQISSFCRALHII